MKIEWASDLPYGLSDLAPDVPEGYKDGTLVRETQIRCCVASCPQWLLRRRRQQLKSEHLYCPEHQISVSTAPTYIYKDYRRNFIIARPLLDTVTKVERWRLGNETSEDAVSWNVFVGLLKLGGLQDCFRLFTGRVPLAEPELYLWGNRIAFDRPPEFFARLKRVRDELEGRAGLPTEPDIIMRVPGQAIVLIEAKFGSPNGVFSGKEDRFGTIQEYLSLYFRRTKEAIH